MTRHDADCKGDWRLGTACGDCPKCHATASDFIRQMSDAMGELIDAAVFASGAKMLELDGKVRARAEKRLAEALNVAVSYVQG